MASDGFIREVDEELQRDRMAGLWKRYGPIAIGVALVVILGTAGKVGWDAWQARQLAQQGAAFAAAQAALDRGNADNAAELFAELAASQSGDTAAIARLWQAQARIAAGDAAAVTPLLDEIAADASLDPIIRDYAAISSIGLTLNAGDRSTIETALAQQMSAEAPFRSSSRELAAIAALAAGDDGRAIELLRDLQSDSATPEDMRRRVAELLAALGVEAGPDAVGAAEAS